jgi:hypothetical protein
MVPSTPAAPPQTVFYVRTDGNDNNSGFANTPTDAFASVQGAMNSIKARYISQNTITIRVADGTYTNGGFQDTTSFIASWDVVGNTANPGNVIIDATSTNLATYIAGALGGRGVNSSYTANITVEGITFKSYYENAVAHAGGNLTISNCNFTAPVTGGAVIASYTDAMVHMQGTCQYSATRSAFALWATTLGGAMRFAHADIYTTATLTMNFPSAPNFTTALMYAASGGTIIVQDNAISFTGVANTAPKYYCQTAGGVVFGTGNQATVPGAPGRVYSPGWVT